LHLVPDTLHIVYETSRELYVLYCKVIGVRLLTWPSWLCCQISI